MIRILLSKLDGRLNQPIETASISDLIVDPTNLIWADVTAPTGEDFAILREEFQFHELALEDATHRTQRPKIDAYDTFYFIVIYAVSFNTGDSTIDEHELDIFVGRNYMVTVHEAPIRELEVAATRWERNAGLVHTSIGVLLYSLVDSVIDGYFPVLDQIGDLTEALEERIFDSFDPRAQQQIFLLRKELLNLRRVLAPERDLLLRLSRRELPVLDEHTEAYFQGVYDHVMRVSDSVDLYRDLLNSALDSYLSVASNNLNLIVRTLTSISIILMSLSFIAGIYGMNFENMPELRTRYGYFVVLGVMAAVAGLLYLYFHRKRWL